jgi:uncharacterized protein (DUF1015 family)
MEVKSIPVDIVENLVYRLDKELNNVYEQILDGADPDDIYKTLEEMKEILWAFPIINSQISDFPNP